MTSDVDYYCLTRGEEKALENHPISTRQFLERYVPEAGLTPPADAGLAGNPVANCEAPAQSRKVGQV